MIKESKDRKKILTLFFIVVIWINIGHIGFYLLERTGWDYNYNGGQMNIAAKVMFPSPTTFKIHRSYFLTAIFTEPSDKKYADFHAYCKRDNVPRLILVLIGPLALLTGWFLALAEWAILLIHVVIWKWLIVGFLWNTVIKFLFGGSWIKWL